MLSSKNDSSLVREYLELFQEILKKEYLIRDEWSFNFFDKHRSTHIFSDVTQLFEIAELSTVPKGYLKSYGLYSEDSIFESVGAHTNLVHAILSLAMDNFDYYAKNHDNEDGTRKIVCEEIERYTREEMHEAITLHDLPTNEIGDWLDNTDRNLEYKKALEVGYFNRFTSHYSYKNPDFARHVIELLENMDPEGSLIGQILYLTNKTSDIITALVYDKKGISPMMHMRQGLTPRRDRLAMLCCDYQNDDCRKASEILTMDFFEIRQFAKCDRTGYFTALIIMATLIVKNTWYTWRKQTYSEHHRLCGDKPKLVVV